MTHTSKSTLRKMLSYYRPYMRDFWADMFFAALSAVCALILPLIVRYVTGSLVYRDAEEIVRQSVWIAAGLLLLAAVECYSRYFIGSYGHVMGAKMEYDMRQELFEHLQKLSFTFYDDAKVGQLMTRITSDLFDITELLHHGPENIILSVLKIAGALIILLCINPWLALAAFILLPFLFVFAFILNGHMHRASRRSRGELGRINEQIEDSLSGIRVVKSFANEDIEIANFRRGNDAFLAAKRDNYHYMGMFQAGVATFTTLIQVCVITAGCLLIAKDMLNVSDFVTFVLYISVFTEPIRTLVEFTEQFQNGYTGFERFQEILNIEPDIEDREDAAELGAGQKDEASCPESEREGTDPGEDLMRAATGSGKDSRAGRIRGGIVFEDVSFHYSGNRETVLNHIDLSIPAGSYTALVGSSGVGKTTLCSLIPRFYEVSSGRVLVDGQDVRAVTMKSLRRHIGVVQQDVYLFSGTVYDNILYGRPGASREDVTEAAKRANAHEFILSLPDGYDTDIGQRGIKLSGGQKQRISIARVFLKDPEILIFDEATSSLDNESERIVQESLEKLAKDRTTLVIAHRLSTIRNADRILVLTEDGIAEEGTHEELLARGGVYAAFYRTR